MSLASVELNTNNSFETFKTKQDWANYSKQVPQTVRFLDLKDKNLTDENISGLAQFLTEDKRFMMLDLSKNKITNVGVGYLTSALKVNQVLAMEHKLPNQPFSITIPYAFNVTSNHIEKEGISALFQTFENTKRKIISLRCNENLLSPEDKKEILTSERMIQLESSFALFYLFLAINPKLVLKETDISNLIL